MSGKRGSLNRRTRRVELVDTNESENALVASDARKTQAPKVRDRAEVEQAVSERAVQQEAEQTIAAEAREQATSAEPPESGAAHH